jgi:hypothetical protein
MVVCVWLSDVCKNMNEHWTVLSLDIIEVYIFQIW